MPSERIADKRKTNAKNQRCWSSFWAKESALPGKRVLSTSEISHNELAPPGDPIRVCVHEILGSL